MNRFRTWLKSTALILLGTMLVFAFENCTSVNQQVSFKLTQSPVAFTPIISYENGQGYYGKPDDGEYQRRLVGFQCDQQLNSLQGLLKIESGNPSIVLDNCINTSFSMATTDSRFEYLPYNKDFIGINSAIFERQNPLATSNRISEAWCRWSQSNEGLDAVIRIEPSGGSVTAQIYSGTSLDSSIWNSKVSTPISIERVQNQNEISYLTQSFDLRLNLAVNLGGRHSGHLKIIFDGNIFDKDVDCRLMGQSSALGPWSNNLVGLWQLNGLAGAVATSISDLSGLGNTGLVTDVNASMRFQPGVFNESLNLVDNDDSVSIRPSATINDLAALTVTAWVRGTADPTNTTVLNGGSIAWKGQSPASAIDPTNLILSSGWYFGIPMQTGRIQFKAAFSGGRLEAMTDSAATRLIPGQWHHIAVTWTGSSVANSARFYIDGQPVPAAIPAFDGVGFRISDAPNNLLLGYYSDNFYGTFKGNLDQVQLWNRSLTPLEINRIYLSGTIFP